MTSTTSTNSVGFTQLLGRGGSFASSSFHNTPDAPRGPAKSRNGAKVDRDHAATSGPPFSSVNTIEKSTKKDKSNEERRTVTDFKIVGLELPELSWKWGIVPEKEREEEGKKRKADGSEAGGEYPGLPVASLSLMLMALI